MAEQTTEQKMIDHLERFVNRFYYDRDAARLHVIVDGKRIRCRLPSHFITGNIYVIKVTNQDGNPQTRLQISIAVSILIKYVDFAPLLEGM